MAARYPLHLPLRSSRHLVALSGAVHLAAALAFLFSSLPWPARLAGVLLILASVFRHARRWRHPLQQVLVLRADGLLDVDGEVVALEAGSTDFGWAIWLHWRAAAGRRQSLMLLPDALPSGRWRPLRIWLRHRARADGGRADER
ncbi:hypothetical protein E6C76_01925 [Pseudothauera nasutitermitis]|uniref:Toxin CptA n=1 Tax=Pseudothauera nasutitermitis TaxID=2565930 RepID=A0A4S4B3M7_9RHOO|nr:protein YgfX [Pseudothauera nasutitermitis]THF67165.1 hypothetical protein E6C76_01925 [Pseudothauera nasutitermitis]